MPSDPETLVGTIERWLSSVGVRRSDTDAAIILLLAGQYDSIDDEQMTPHQAVTARRQILKDVTDRQIKIESSGSAAATIGSREWASIAGVWMGMIPIELLPDTLAARVKQWLLEEHNIPLEIWDSTDS